MALDKLTKIDGGGISTTSNYRVGIITATKFVGPIEGTITSADATFTGNVSIAGTLTYEDVTNVDSVGVITARNGIKVSTGTATTALVVDGDARVTGILTVGTSSLKLDGPNNLVNVGTALTLGHSQGVQFHTQNLHSAGFEVNQINASGIITATGADINGDLDVDGHTNLDNVSIAGVTTTNTLHVAANNTTVGVAITQSGSGDILKLYDGTSEVFTVANQDDGIGAVTISSPKPRIVFNETNASPDYQIRMNGGNFSIHDSTNDIGRISISPTRTDINNPVLINNDILYIGDKLVHWTDDDTAIRFPSANAITAETGGSERLRIDSTGVKVHNGRFYSAGTFAYIESSSLSTSTLTLKKSASGADSIDYLQLRDNSNGIKFTIHGDGTLKILDTISHEGDTDTKIRFPSDDTISFEVGGSESFRVDASGKLLIGQTSDSDGQICMAGVLAFSAGGSGTASGANARPNISRGTNGQLILAAGKDSGSTIRFDVAANGSTNAAEVVRITSSGVLKLTGQSTSFETAGFTHHTNNNLYIRGGTTGAILQSVDGNEAWVVQNDYVSASTSGSERLRITSGGQVRIGNENNLALWGQNNRLQVAGTDWNTSGITIACMSNSGSANLVMGNSRASTPGGSGGALVQDSRLGYISFVGDDGTDMNTVGAAIVAELDSNASSNSMPGRLRFYTGGNSSERLRITSTGDINIHNTTAASTTDPVTLDLGGQFTANASITQANLKLKLYHNGSNGDAAGLTASAEGLAYVGGHTTGHVFYTVPSSVNSLVERLRIASNGNVAIGGDTNNVPRHLWLYNASNDPYFRIQRGTTSDVNMGGIEFASSNGNGNNMIGTIYGRATGNSATTGIVIVKARDSSSGSNLNEPLRALGKSSSGCRLMSQGNAVCVFGRHHETGGTDATADAPTYNTVYEHSSSSYRTNGNGAFGGTFVVGGNASTWYPVWFSLPTHQDPQILSVHKYVHNYATWDGKLLFRASLMGTGYGAFAVQHRIHFFSYSYKQFVGKAYYTGHNNAYLILWMLGGGRSYQWGTIGAVGITVNVGDDGNNHNLGPGNTSEGPITSAVTIPVGYEKNMNTSGTHQQTGFS